MGCWWQRDTIVMHALSSIFETVRCPEHVRHAPWISSRPISQTTSLANHVANLALPGTSLGNITMPDSAPQQLLHLVIGGELTDLEHTTFKDLDQVEIVGVYPNYATAYAAWKAKAQQTVDNAHMRYFVVHLHRLLDPGQDTKQDAKPDAKPSR
jgi:hypothetical protein